MAFKRQRLAAHQRKRFSAELLEHRRMLATFTVTNLVDGPVMADGDLPGSLRQAIFDANDTPGADTIEFQQGLTGVIKLVAAELTVTDAVEIDGPGAAALTIDGQRDSQVIHVNDSTPTNIDVSISSLTIANGESYYGGGIDNHEGLTVTNSVVTENIGWVGAAIHSSATASLAIDNTTVTGNYSLNIGGAIAAKGVLTLDSSLVASNGVRYRGGGIYATGHTTITNSEISNNGGGDSTFGGGVYAQNYLAIIDSTISNNFAYSKVGVFVMNGELTMVNSTVTGNFPRRVAGGIYTNGVKGEITNSTISSNYGGGLTSRASVFTITDSTINGNVTPVSGGGINTDGGTTILNSTISGNSAVGQLFLPYGDGGGIAVYAGNVQISSSTVTENFAIEDGGGIYAAGNANVDITNTIVAGNESVKGSGILGNVDASFSLIGGDPLLGALANNGGTTQTHALLPSSPALDAGDPDFVPPPNFDQRGDPFARVFGGRIDIGSFESQPFVVDGDFNDDSLYDCLDIDALVAAIAASTNRSR